MPAKAGIQKYLKTLASRPTLSRGQALRGNDAKRRIKTFYEIINFKMRVRVA